MKTKLRLTIIFDFLMILNVIFYYILITKKSMFLNIGSSVIYLHNESINTFWGQIMLAISPLSLFVAYCGVTIIAIIISFLLFKYYRNYISALVSYIFLTMIFLINLSIYLKAISLKWIM